MNGSIKQKMLLLVGIFILTIVTVSTGLLYLLKSGNQFSEQLANDHMSPLVILGDIKSLIQDSRSEVMLALGHNPEGGSSGFHNHNVEVHFDKIAENRAKIDLAFDKYRNHKFSKGEEESLQKLKEARDDFVKNGLSKVVKEIQEGSYEEGTLILLKEMNPRISKTLMTVDELSTLLRTTTEKDIAEQKETYAFTQYLVIFLVALVCVLVSILSLIIARSFIQPIQEAVRVARTIASGNLTIEISTGGNNETGYLLQALDEMIHSLRNIVHNVRSGSESIAVATHQIAGGNHDLAIRTEQQASHLGVTTNNIREFTVAMGINADHAIMANTMIADTAKVAYEAGKYVREVVDTMKSIDESSLKIVDIIGVIDSIAFQTNILALNAAVEAARAGDQGRGFAVVATEVRALAQRSAAAAKEIKTLINSSVERVERGIVLVDQAGITMTQVVASVEQASHIISDISKACSGQQITIEQVNKTLADMDSMTQQNAALVEEAAAASESLDAQTQTLKEVVSVFRLKHA